MIIFCLINIFLVPQAAQQEQYQQYSIGYSLANTLLSDTLGKQDADLLPLLKEAVSWVVEMGTSDLKFHAMLDALGVSLLLLPHFFLP